MDKYHEMMMTGMENHIKDTRESAKHLRSKAQILIAQAEQMDTESRLMESMRDDWEKALKALEPAK